MTGASAHVCHMAELVSPGGSRKLNMALMQAYMNKRKRVKRLAAETVEKKVILLNLSGHCHFNLSAHDAYLSGKMDFQS